MKNYSIVRVGNEYVVQANEKSDSEDRKPAKSRKNRHGCGGAPEFTTGPAIVAASARRSINRP
jgi:hypothetical protein